MVDDNTDCIKYKCIIMLINHTQKNVIILSIYDTYRGFYCFIKNYMICIYKVLFTFEYKIYDICSLDGFSVYKDMYETNIYEKVFDKYYYKTVESINKNNYYEIFLKQNRVTKICTENLLKKYKIDYKNTISIYYRATDKIKEVQLPDKSKFVDKILCILSNNKNINSIIIQTDDIDSMQYFKNKFSHINVIIFDEINISSGNKSAFHNMKDSFKIDHCIIFNSIINIISNTSNILLMPSSSVSHYICKIKNKKSNLIKIN